MNYKLTSTPSEYLGSKVFTHTFEFENGQVEILSFDTGNDSFFTASSFFVYEGSPKTIFLWNNKKSRLVAERKIFYKYCNVCWDDIDSIIKEALSLRERDWAELSNIFNLCIEKKLMKDKSLEIHCKLGLWSASGINHEAVEDEARNHWNKHFKDGAYVDFFHGR